MYFKLERSKFSLNFEFNRNTFSETGARLINIIVQNYELKPSSSFSLLLAHLPV